jgi:hypothetical protein
MPTCLTCKQWNLKAGSLARFGMAPCAFGERYTHLSHRMTCARHKPLEQAAAKARTDWIARLYAKHKKGTK